MRQKTLSPHMKAVMFHFREHGELPPKTHRGTIKALLNRELVKFDPVKKTYAPGDKLKDNEIKEMGISEMIGEPRVNKLATQWINREFALTPTRDWGQADYTFWNRARWGRAQGLELAGLFLKPLASKIAAWALGMTPDFKFDNPKAQEKVGEWFANHHADVLRGYEESLSLADIYLVVNADLSITVVPPNVVEPMVDEANDYSKLIGWRITETHPHPTRLHDMMTITDEYTETERTRKISKNGATMSVKSYPNLIGRIPVIHIANNRGVDETFGHAEGEALLTALQQYGIIFSAAIAGNKKQGRPTPVIEKMGTVQQIDAFWERFGHKETRELEDGTTETYWELDLDTDNVITLGGDAVFRWAQPGSFAADATAFLGLIFYLMLQHTEVPEFIWGNAIASSKASAESQMEPFVKFIEKKRGACQWLKDLAMVVAAYLSIWERGVSVKDESALSVQWPNLTQDDQRLTLDAIKLGLERGLLDDETALSLMPLDIENPAEVLQKVKDQMEAQRAEEDARQEALIARIEERRGQAGDQADEDENADAGETGDGVDEIWTRALRVIVDEQAHTGVMAALSIPRGLADELWRAANNAGVKNITEPGDMHLTLAYLGEASEMEVSREELEQLVRKYASWHSPFTGRMAGLGRFKADEGNDTNAFYASVNSVALADFRQELVRYLTTNGVKIARFEFTPHITVAYIPADAPTPHFAVPDAEIRWGSVGLYWGDTQMHIDLTEEKALA